MVEEAVVEVVNALCESGTGVVEVERVEERVKCFGTSGLSCHRCRPRKTGRRVVIQ